MASVPRRLIIPTGCLLALAACTGQASAATLYANQGFTNGPCGSQNSTSHNIRYNEMSGSSDPHSIQLQGYASSCANVGYASPPGSFKSGLGKITWGPAGTAFNGYVAYCWIPNPYFGTGKCYWG